MTIALIGQPGGPRCSRLSRIAEANRRPCQVATYPRYGFGLLCPSTVTRCSPNARSTQDVGIVVERVLSDNAKPYHSHLWRETCAELEIARRYTRPYSPWTNGKAEALIKTLLREWAYRFAIPRAHTAAVRCLASLAGTTDADPTARLKAGHRSAVSHRSVVSTASSPGSGS